MSLFTKTIMAQHLTIVLQIYAILNRVLRSIEHRTVWTPVAFSQVTDGVRCDDRQTPFRYLLKKLSLLRHRCLNNFRREPVTI